MQATTFHLNAIRLLFILLLLLAQSQAFAMGPPGSDGWGKQKAGRLAAGSNTAASLANLAQQYEATLPREVSDEEEEEEDPDTEFSLKASNYRKYLTQSIINTLLNWREEQDKLDAGGSGGFIRTPGFNSDLLRIRYLSTFRALDRVDNPNSLEFTSCPTAEELTEAIAYWNGRRAISLESNRLVNSFFDRVTVRADKSLFARKKKEDEGELWDGSDAQ